MKVDYHFAAEISIGDSNKSDAGFLWKMTGLFLNLIFFDVFYIFFEEFWQERASIYMRGVKHHRRCAATFLLGNVADSVFEVTITNKRRRREK